MHYSFICTANPYQLDGSEMLFPPEELLVCRPHSRQTIVRVHDDMDNAVEQSMEGAKTTCVQGGASSQYHSRNCKTFNE